MNMILTVAAGGAIGSVLRFLAGRASLAWMGPSFPYGTLFVNVFGSFIMGMITASFAHFGETSQELRAFLTIGILGGFTTFSSFSLDVATLYERGEFSAALLYVFLSLALSFAGIFTGMFLVRSIAA